MEAIATLLKITLHRRTADAPDFRTQMEHTFGLVESARLAGIAEGRGETAVPSPARWAQGARPATTGGASSSGPGNMEGGAGSAGASAHNPGPTDDLDHSSAEFHSSPSIVLGLEEVERSRRQTVEAELERRLKETQDIDAKLQHERRKHRDTVSQMDALRERLVEVTQWNEECCRRVSEAGDDQRAAEARVAKLEATVNRLREQLEEAGIYSD